MTELLEGKRAADLLGDSVTETFAEIAFIDVLKVSSSTNPEPFIHAGMPVPDDQRCAVIDILMPLSCRLELKVDIAHRDRIVDNLFGDFPVAMQKKMADDSLLEMLNVISGAFLSAYFGKDTTIQLELPRLLYIAESPVGQSIARVQLEAEGKPLSATLTSVRYRY
jgi:hypothetical protein